MSNKYNNVQKPTDPVTETVDIEINHPEHLRLQLLEYKFVLYKFPKPIQRNIQSLQVLLETNDSFSDKAMYISLNANLLQLTTPVKISPNVLTQVLQYAYLPTQLTPDYQYQLIATIENSQLLNASTITPTEIQVNLKVIIKYFVYENVELIDKLTVTHNNDIKTLVVKNGNIYVTKLRETSGSLY